MPMQRSFRGSELDCRREEDGVVGEGIIYAVRGM